METVTIQIEIPTAQYKLLETLAAQRGSSINDLIVSILSEWVEREERLEEGRKLMLQLGEGLVEGKPPHDAARNHDVYLYGKKPS